MAKRKKTVKVVVPRQSVIFMGTALEEIRKGQVVTVILELPSGNTFMRPATTQDALEIERGLGNS